MNKRNISALHPVNQRSTSLFKLYYYKIELEKKVQLLGSSSNDCFEAALVVTARKISLYLEMIMHQLLIDCDEV
uniref:Uncharacterized protein n=1 Tax=Arion vulgaris TaxID=1028688 RepID=A0A0B7A101_9EUPU